MAVGENRNNIPIIKSGTSDAMAKDESARLQQLAGHEVSIGVAVTRANYIDILRHPKYVSQPALIHRGI
jgi:hypothetical protein